MTSMNYDIQIWIGHHKEGKLETISIKNSDGKILNKISTNKIQRYMKENKVWENTQGI